MLIQQSRPCKECWRVKSGVLFDFVIFPLLTGEFKVKTFPKLPEPPQLFPPEKRWAKAHSCNGTPVIMCSYPPISRQHYQVSKAKYTLATLQKSAPVQQIISNTTMRKRKENTGKYLVSLNQVMRGCYIQQDVLWRYISVSRVVEILGKNGVFSVKMASETSWGHWFTSKCTWNPEAEIRSRQGQEGNKVFTCPFNYKPIHSITKEQIRIIRFSVCILSISIILNAYEHFNIQLV